MEMKIINPNAGGIDIGSRCYHTAVGQGDDEIKEFGVSHQSQLKLLKYLKDSGVTTVAMESTGSYWQSLYLVLVEAGIEVLLVPGTQTKAFRKTDVKDARQLQKLHALGMLGSCFLPDRFTAKVRELCRHRKSLVRDSSKYTLKMQKCLRLMNIRLDVVLSDITGVSGRKIINAILAGERDPQKLAKLADRRVKKSPEELVDALVGYYSEELLYELKDCFEIFMFYQDKIEKLDSEVSKYYNEHLRGTKIPESVELAKKQLKGKNQPKFPVQKIAYRMYGVDLSRIKGVSVNTILSIISEVGLSFDRFKNSNCFVSWLCLCPNNKVSGGKKLNGRTPKGKNQLALALRDAANVIGNQRDGHLSAFFRKIALKKGRAAAVTATARKLAIIIFNMITNKEEYDESRYQLQQERINEKRLKNAIKLLKNHNLQIVDCEGLLM